VTKAVTLKVSDIKNKDSKKGKTRSFKATTKLKRGDFHVGAAAGYIADDITITLDIKLEQ
jgi:polyisoprenoid-binding protein YceI